MTGRRATITFYPLKRTKDIAAGATILAAATQSGVPIGHSCSGDGICGWCRVTVLTGGENLVPPTDIEIRLMAEKGFQENERAACLACIRGNLTVTTTYW